MKDNLEACITNTYNRDDIDEAMSRQDQSEREHMLQRIKHRETEALKRNLKQSCTQMELRT